MGDSDSSGDEGEFMDHMEQQRLQDMELMQQRLQGLEHGQKEFDEGMDAMVTACRKAIAEGQQKSIDAISSAITSFATSVGGRFEELKKQRLQDTEHMQKEFEEGMDAMVTTLRRALESCDTRFSEIEALLRAGRAPEQVPRGIG